ncbi:MAG: hypothetical protein A2234_06985 [Elusimicrobia bacterium RIFOXYA2_FULL_58_8]|nr:MAG: hypothetical protein A2234_06985 [Elusimicrobia bacterium RIFOXYA2_FULL_58_8]OGS14321.1 MAG: hypothetical protein A2285_08645 [Elusimicrobia bacterium RIFOXYA12_FULL_57_11]
MHILNYYFTPFAVILIAFAVFFSEPEKNVTYASFALLGAAFAVNYWLSANVYRLMQITRSIRGITVWLNLLTSAALFYMLSPYWAPMWLLFLTAPAAAAMFMKKWQVFLTSLAAAALMLGIYYLRSVVYGMGLSSQLLGMAGTQAIFIIFFSMFTAAMAEMATKVRDSMR